MELIPELIAEMVVHAIEDSPNEACGLVVSSGGSHRLVRSANVAANPRQTFQIDEAAWQGVADAEDVVAVYHSHPRGTADPSMSDLEGIELLGLPWYIVSTSGASSCTYPSGFQAPYVGRPYVFGVHDCYALVRDWYNREWNLGLEDVPRNEQDWRNGQNLFLENYQDLGFHVVKDRPLQVGDAVLIQMAGKFPNHAAVYVGDGQILHHTLRRLSSRDLYGGIWQRHTTHQLRHKSRMNHG